MKLQKLYHLAVLILPSLLIGAVLFSSESKDDEVKQIETLLKSQDAAWNNGDLESFMQTYWKSDKMTFSGSGTTRRGWDATLASYQKSYPTQKEMGKLHFDGLETTLFGVDGALVLGNWHLKLDGKDRDGNFTLVMRKIEGKWKIIHDHSAELESEKGWLNLKQAEMVARCKIDVMDDNVVIKNQGHLMKVFPPWKHLKEGEKTVYVDRKSGMIHSSKPSAWNE